MPGDFASVLLSTSPPIFSSSPRLSFNVVNDMTKSYFFRLTNHCATDATPGSNELLPSSVSSSSSDSLALDASYASLANLTNLRLQSTRNGRCFSDTDVQRSWQFASAVIQRCSLNRSEPALNAECKQTNAADKNRYHGNDSDSDSDSLQSNTSKETEIPATNECDLSTLALLDTTCTSGQHDADADKQQKQLATRNTEKQSQDAAKPASIVSTATRRNKKGHYVRFADELGKELSAVRVIENVLDMKSAATTEYTDADCISSRCTPLVVEFAQPVADYARFRERLDSQNVCLENVLVSGFRVSGTVRVRNLAFEKRVFVRVSTDHWQSYTDHYATYVSASANASASSAYDSFAFDLGDLSNQLMLRSGNSWSATQQRIEIAVCFTSGSQIFWDNNAGRNYIVSYTPAATSRSQKSYTSSYRPDFSAFRENFSEFTAWNHYDSYNPYY